MLIYAYFFVFHPIMFFRAIIDGWINPCKMKMLKKFKESYEDFKIQYICKKEGHVWESNNPHAPCIRNCGYHKPHKPS